MYDRLFEDEFEGHGHFTFDHRVEKPTGRPSITRFVGVVRQDAKSLELVYNETMERLTSFSQAFGEIPSNLDTAEFIRAQLSDKVMANLSVFACEP